MRLMLVDDHVLFREGLVSLINAQPDLEVVGEAGSVAESVALARAVRPDLILMDFSLPDGTGLEATVTILAEQPQIQIVFLTFHEDDERLFDAIRAGARGYLLKNVSSAKLLAYVRGVKAGEAALMPQMTSRILEEFARLPTPARPLPEAPSVLTDREAEVLRELASGASNRDIADRLVISENTVKNHVRSILSKLGLQNRREAARFAREQGLAGRSTPD
jgi:DNA-binding NarL/FixJ family response regulator